MLQPKVTPWCPDKGVTMGMTQPPLHTPRLDDVLNGQNGDMVRTWCESILNPTYHNIFPTGVIDPFDWGGVPVRVVRNLGIRRVKEQIWKWYRERGCSDAVVEMVFMINNHDSFKYYVKHICEYICGGKWMVQRVPYTLNVVYRLQSCATTIRNELFDIVKTQEAKKEMVLLDDWRIHHVPMQLVDVPSNCQGKHLDIVDDPLSCVQSNQQRHGGYPSV